jgi:hypothetical protein
LLSTSDAGLKLGEEPNFSDVPGKPFTSFKFLDTPLIPKTTNELEAQFGHPGKRWLSHRGMKRERWKDFLKWFVHFYNQEKLSQKKLKEAEITNINS